MKRSHRSRLSLGVIAAIAGGLLAVPVKAVQFSDGTIHFAGVPRLGKVSTTDNQAWAWSATYYFTIQVPADASEPLGRVVMQQTEGVDSIDFNLKRTFAYLDGDKNQTIPLQATNTDKDALNVQFDTPIEPGKTVTLGLRPYNNPHTGGVYLFGVTAFPAGEKVQSQFIGTGRLQFYDRSFWHDRW
ncbi:MAG: DUF2808 domain-containing protein [Acaryochloridaceae cyanobacterium RU_4_10]|nr:DUF2808 domain-containing protein [Acaryochloridaceae cyanobacterium RU_4_10]